MNKGRRHELKMLHYRKRLKKLRIKESPTSNLTAFRSHGKPCSCCICRGLKYRDNNRAKNKRVDIETKNILNMPPTILFWEFHKEEIEENLKSIGW